MRSSTSPTGKGYSFDYYEVGRTNRDEPINPAVATVLGSMTYTAILRSIAQRGEAMFIERSRKRTGAMAASTTVSMGQLGTFNSTLGRTAAIMSVDIDYAGAVEFGGANLARVNKRPLSARRVLPGAFPARYAGDHVLGGDNRRVRSVVADLERRYNRDLS